MLASENLDIRTITMGISLIALGSGDHDYVKYAKVLEKSEIIFQEVILFSMHEKQLIIDESEEQ